MRLRVRAAVLLLLSSLLGVLTYRFLSVPDSSSGYQHTGVGREAAVRDQDARRTSTGHKEEKRGVNSPVRQLGAGEDFQIREPFAFPQPAFSRSAPELLHSQWVKDLQAHLRPLPRGSQVSVVISSVEHTEVLLNWLVAALVKLMQPLRNVLVISMDSGLHHMLVSRGVSSLFVHKDMVVSPDAEVPRVFSQVHVVRLAVLRLINHYGYDIINYDCDAIPLHNPQPIFDKYRSTDLIGTFGKGPDVLYRKWGVALNTGVMVMRATDNMGKG